MVYGLSIILIVPLIYVLNNPNYFVFSFFISGLLSFFIFNLSKRLNNEKIISILIFLIPIPIFFSIFDGNKNFLFKFLNEELIPKNLFEISVHLPISCLVLPFLLVALLNNQKNISNTIYFVTLSFFIALTSLTYTDRINFFNFVNLLQFYIPLIAIVCGEIIGSNEKLNSKFMKYFFIVVSIVMLLQIIFTIFYETNSLNPNIFLFYIYQSEQYSSLAIILIFFIFIQRQIIKYQSIYSYKIYLPFFLLLLYVYLSKNLLIYLYLIFYISFLAIIIKKYLVPKIIFVAISLFLLYYSYDKITFDIDTFLKYKINYYQTYYLEITKNINNFLFGSNAVGELYNNISGIFNYYLDFIYNFGFLAITPLFALIFLTIRNTYKTRKLLILDKYNLSLFLIILIILFIDSFLKVSLKQPYIGIIIYFIWGVYYSRIKNLNK